MSLAEGIIFYGATQRRGRFFLRSVFVEGPRSGQIAAKPQQARDRPKLECWRPERDPDGAIQSPKSPFDPQFRPFAAFSFTLELIPRYHSPCNLRFVTVASRERLGVGPLPLALPSTDLTALPDLNYLLAVSCSLFGVPEKVISGKINKLQPLLQNTPGWGWICRGLPWSSAKS
jgi:hypothetical protein